MWDGKRKQINGITIFFAHPETLDLYRIPVALTPPDGKTALALCENTLAGVGRYGITSEDFWRAVNDNCDVAKKTGRLVVGGGNETEENGQCDMHLAALAAGLALSLVKR